MKWDDSHPGLIVEEIEVKRGRNRSAQFGHIDAPVREEQVMPRLRHQPRPSGYRPWPMSRVVDDGVVEAGADRRLFSRDGALVCAQRRLSDDGSDNQASSR